MNLIERLRERLDYDPTSGEFTWKVSPNARIKAGSKAGSVNSDGYILIKVDGRNIKAHRIAWALIHGDFPESEIDHINRLPGDNRLCNLRLATRSQNNTNKVKFRPNKLGIKGVTKQRNGYQVNISDNGKQKYVGYYATIEAAQAAYQREAERIGCDFRPS